VGGISQGNFWSHSGRLVATAHTRFGQSFKSLVALSTATTIAVAAVDWESQPMAEMMKMIAVSFYSAERSLAYLVRWHTPIVSAVEKLGGVSAHRCLEFAQSDFAFCPQGRYRPLYLFGYPQTQSQPQNFQKWKTMQVTACNQASASMTVTTCAKIKKKYYHSSCVLIHRSNLLSGACGVHDEAINQPKIRLCNGKPIWLRRRSRTTTMPFSKYTTQRPLTI
jgi:hypothetical protein